MLLSTTARIDTVRREFIVAVAAIALLLVGGVSTAWGQYSQVTTPFHTLNDDFFENFNVGFNFGIATPPGSGVVGLNPDGSVNPFGIVFSQGPTNTTAPTIGGYDPNGDAVMGFGLRGSGYAANFNFRAGQGSNRTMSTIAPTVVLPNGGQGTIIDTNQVPFVTGVIPVVGDGAFGFGRPTSVSPLYERMNRLQAERAILGQDRDGYERAASGGGGSTSRGTTSTATRGDLSVAEIKRQQAAGEAQSDRELDELLERARGAELSGKPNVARIFYRMAAQRAVGEQQKELQAKLDALETQK